MWAKYKKEGKNIYCNAFKRQLFYVKIKFIATKGEVENEKILPLNLYYIWTDLILWQGKLSRNKGTYCKFQSNH